MLKIMYLISIILNLYLFYDILKETGYKNIVNILNIILFIYLMLR